MATDRRDSNAKVLTDAEKIQQESIFKLSGITRQVEEDKAIAGATLEELREQSQQMDEIHANIAVVGTKLDTSLSLLNKFDMWAGNWSGAKKREALKEAAAEIAARDESTAKIREVFEQEKFNKGSKVWEPAGFVSRDKSVPNLFDPASIASQQVESDWSIDYSMSHIDNEGWTYASNFEDLNKNGAGSAEATKSTFVRRRKWKKKISKAGSQTVQDRNAPNGAKTAAAKTHYVPRNQVHAGIPIPQTGETTTGLGKKSSDQHLDNDSEAGLAKLKANDQKIDDGIDRVSNGIDDLLSVASGINAELKVQARKIDSIETDLDHVNEKEIIVNARLRKLVSTPTGGFFSFTLESQIKEAARSTNDLFTGSWIIDKSIPINLILRSKGLAYLRTGKAGFVLGVKYGRGLVIGRLPDGSWSAPSAIGTGGVSGGLQAGLDITDHIIILNTDEAVRAFSGKFSVSLGAGIEVAVGPIGRDASANINMGANGIAPAFSYSRSKGLYAGVSLEGSIIRSCSDANENFYGRSVDPMDLIQGNIPRPIGAQPLYDALDKAVTYSTNPSLE